MNKYPYYPIVVRDVSQEVRDYLENKRKEGVSDYKLAWEMFQQYGNNHKPKGYMPKKGIKSIDEIAENIKSSMRNTSEEDENKNVDALLRATCGDEDSVADREDGTHPDELLSKGDVEGVLGFNDGTYEYKSVILKLLEDMSVEEVDEYLSDKVSDSTRVKIVNMKKVSLYVDSLLENQGLVLSLIGTVNKQPEG